MGVSVSPTPAEQEHVFGAYADPKALKNRQNEIIQNGGVKAGFERGIETPKLPAEHSAQEMEQHYAAPENSAQQGERGKPKNIQHPDNQHENWEDEYIQSQADLLDQPVLLSNSSKKHIDIGGDLKDHSTPLALVRKTIREPDAIYENIKSNGKKAYFLVKEDAIHPTTTTKPMRVVVKTTTGPDKHVASTAYGTSKKPKGKVLWQKK